MIENLIIVDIQPAYSKFIDFNVDEYINWINNSSFDEIFCLYNGPDLGYDDDEYKIEQWYYSWGLDRDIKMRFFEKSYGWFRDFMEDMDEQNIISIGKYMIEHDIWDSRYFKRKDIKILKDRGIRTRYLNTEDRVMYIPELKDYLSNNIYTDEHITICGGGVNECYKEVNMLLKMMGYKFKEKIKFIY